MPLWSIRRWLPSKGRNNEGFYIARIRQIWPKNFASNLFRLNGPKFIRSFAWQIRGVSKLPTEAEFRRDDGDT